MSILSVVVLKIRVSGQNQAAHLLHLSFITTSVSGPADLPHLGNRDHMLLGQCNKTNKFPLKGNPPDK